MLFTSEFEIDRIANITTWNYIIFNNKAINMNDGHSDYKGFDMIEFQNGAIKSVYSMWAIHRDINKSNELNDSITDTDKDELGHNPKYIVYKMYPRSREIVTDINGKSIEWTFGTIINNRASVDNGNVLDNSTAYLQVDFENIQGLQTFYDFYGYIVSILSFMTFRSKIEFEKIELKLHSGQVAPISMAECYVKTSDSIILGNGYRKTRNENEIRNVYARSAARSLSISRLSDEHFQYMLDSVMGIKKKLPGLPLDIIPKDDRDVALFTTEKVGKICTALEVEVDSAKIRVAKDDMLTGLIDNVKKIVDEYKGLPQKTYDKIYASISHWGDSLADRAIEAWKVNKDIMKMAENGWLSIDSITNEMIAKFVRVRNRITHDGMRNLDDEIAHVGYAMIVLTYSMALRRIGLSNDTITDLLKRGLLT